MDAAVGYYLGSFDYSALRDALLLLGPEGDRHYRTAKFDFRTDKPVNEPSALVTDE